MIEGYRVAANIGETCIQTNGCIAKREPCIFCKAEVEVEREMAVWEGL